MRNWIRFSDFEIFFHFHPIRLDCILLLTNPARSSVFCYVNRMNGESTSMVKSAPSMPLELSAKPAGAGDPSDSIRSKVIDSRMLDLKRKLAEVLSDLKGLAEQCGDPNQAKLIQDSLAAVNDPFRFVVIGEVKSGKSSFINSLLGADICKVAPEPCTDAIQEIVYADQEMVEVLGPNRKRIGRPIDFLKTITIVDTPGTNSMVNNHELIAREYIPHSDLVVFVFSAKNPHTRSAWDFLHFVRQEWSRKVIFVLQQMDLEPDHLAQQLQSVRDYAVQGGISSPTIFATSARWESQGQAERSGLATVRLFIRESITGGRHILQKLEGHVSAAQKVLSTISQQLDAAKQKLDLDRAYREKVRARLGRGHDRSTREVEDLLTRLLNAYDAIIGDFKEEFRQGMDVWTLLRRSMPGGVSNKEWLEDLQRRLEASLERKVNQVATEEAQLFMDSIKALLLDLLEDTRRDTSPTATAGALSRIERQRQEILDGIKTQLESLARDQEPLQQGVSAASRNIGQAVVGGGLLTGIGAIIATVTKVVIFDITGGILATMGLLVAGFALFWKRGKIIDQFSQALDRSKVHFARELRDKLTADLRGIYAVIDQKFADLDVLLVSQEKDLPPKLEKVAQIESRLAGLQNQIASLRESS